MTKSLRIIVGVLALIFSVRLDASYGQTNGIPFNVPSMAILSSYPARIMASYGTFNLNGYYAGSTAGGGTFTWLTAAQASGLTPDGGVVIAPSDHAGVCTSGCLMRQLFQGTVTPQMFGAYGDGTHDDTTAVQDAISAAIALGPRNTIQDAPAAQVFCPPGTYKVTSSIAISASGSPLPNVGLRISGGYGACTLAGNIAGPVMELYTQSAPVIVDKIYITNSNSSADNACIQIEGNGQIVDQIWGECLKVIDIESINGEPASDIKLSKIQGDQAGVLLHIGTLATDGTVAPHNISLDQSAEYGANQGASSETSGIVCDAAATNITVTNFSTETTSGHGVILRNGCTLTMSAYDLWGNNYGTALPNQVGFDVESGTLDLGVGRIHGWNGEAFFIAGGSTVNDSGADISAVNITGANCSTAASVCVHSGTYIKNGGAITGGNDESYLISMVSGNLILSHSHLSSSKGGAISAAGSLVTIDGNIMENLNTSLSDTDIALGAVTSANVNGNLVSNSGIPTDALTYTSGTVNIIYNNAHQGAWPSSSGSLVAVGNTNF